MAYNVDITDARWPSLREAARRFLREDGCVLSVPQNYENDAWTLIQKISDYVPSKLDLPTVIIGELRVVGLAHIGGDEPSMDVCWVPESNWEDFSEQVLDLLDADIQDVLDAAVLVQKVNGKRMFAETKC